MQTVRYTLMSSISGPPPALPAAPSIAPLEVLSASAIRATWTNNATNATGIKIDISTDGASWTSVVGPASIPPVLNPTSTEYIFTGLKGGQTYFVRVRATNSQGDSANAQASATTRTQTAPVNAPSNFRVTGTTSTTISLAWNDNGSGGNYTIQRSLDGLTNWVDVLYFTNSTGTTFTINGLHPGMTYYFRMHGVQDSGNANGTSPPSPFTPVISATTSAGAAASTVYVSPTGNDNLPGDGSIGNPWQTIQKALNSVVAGSRILLNAGTYAQGASTLNIIQDDLTIEALPAQAVFITGTSGIVLWHHGVNTCIRNIDISGLTTATYANKWEVGGQFLLYITDLACTQNSTTVTSANGGFTASMVGQYLTTITEGTTGTFLPGVRRITAFLDANTIQLESSPATAANGLGGTAYIGGSILDTCTAHDTAAPGHNIKSSTPGGSQIICHGCTSYNGAAGNGFDFVLGSNIIVQDCYSHDNASAQISSKGGGRNCLFQRNKCIPNTGATTNNFGIWMGQSTDPHLFDLTVNTAPYEAINCIVRNNKISNCSVAGIQSQGSKHVMIYNNTLYHTAPPGGAACIYFKIQDTVSQAQCDSPEVYNNLIQQAAATGRQMMDFHNADPTGTVLMDNNIYWVEGGALPTFASGGGSLSYAAWKALGRDQHSINADPLLNTSTLDITTGSPAIDAGKTLASFNDDYNHAIRPHGSAWDIGADEF